MKYGTYFLLILILFVYSCKKAEDRTCWKSSGKEVYKLINLDSLSFKGFELQSNIDYEFIKDTSNYVVIQSYKNIINNIDIQTKDSIVVLKDFNKCNFLRNYNKRTKIKLHYKNISVISIKNNGNVKSTTPITSNIIHIYSHSANGKIDISVNTNSLVVKLINGTLNGKIYGNATNANIFHFGYSKIYLEELDVQNMYIENKSDSDVFIKSYNNLIIKLLSLGNIYYKGNPNINIIENKYGSDVINNN